MPHTGELCAAGLKIPVANLKPILMQSPYRKISSLGVIGVEGLCLRAFGGYTCNG
jgi:hypothetical protein